jgi:hypothetical protein
MRYARTTPLFGVFAFLFVFSAAAQEQSAPAPDPSTPPAPPPAPATVAEADTAESKPDKAEKKKADAKKEDKASPASSGTESQEAPETEGDPEPRDPPAPTGASAGENAGENAQAGEKKGAEAPDADSKDAEDAENAGEKTGPKTGPLKKPQGTAVTKKTRPHPLVVGAFQLAVGTGAGLLLAPLTASMALASWAFIEGSPFYGSGNAGVWLFGLTSGLGILGLAAPAAVAATEVWVGNQLEEEVGHYILPMAGGTVVGLLAAAGAVAVTMSVSSGAVQEGRERRTPGSELYARVYSSIILSTGVATVLSALAPAFIYRFAVDTHDMAGPPPKKPRGLSPFRALEDQVEGEAQ